MSSTNIKVNLLMSADTTLAQQNISQLAVLLRSLGTTKIGFDSGNIKTATEDVKQLQLHLQNALNQNTGKLDLTKLNTSLKSTNSSLSQLSSSLISLGPAGEQAFVRVASAIAQAEAPMMRFGAKTQELFKTFANTAKWQLASTAIHGITGAISDSISYIEKFDKALTDIKIVSDINNKDLAKFAKSTHEIAKEIGSTSLDVAKGATIFYQQGLDTKDVEERVKITEKMANITGETPETVSSQLTAIWNNFDNGTKSLEAYADILTYLGATTAADTNQIATAMQKFAASADNVGLSYEYASSMVAEVIDRTQMAPETVGTAMNTILSRLQGVKLGETLEDGIDLNKYGEALETVGVDVLDKMTGELRDADDILSDLGQRWATLDEGQRKALATTVAGVRQQTQFMAMMGEWSDIEQTVNSLALSTGFLNEKNEEWKNSLEGIKKAYTQTKQEMYQVLFGDKEPLKFFYKGLTEVAEGVTGLVKQFGGLKPLILTIVGVFSRQLMPKIIDGGRAISNGIAHLFGITNYQTNKLKNEFTSIINDFTSKNLISSTMKESLMLSQNLAGTKHRLIEATKRMGTAEKDIVKFKIEQLEYLTREVQAELDKVHALEQQVKLQKELLVEQSKADVGSTKAVEKFKESHKDDENFTEEKQERVIEMATTMKPSEINHAIETAPERVNQDIEDLKSRKMELEAQKELQGKVTGAYEKQIDVGLYDTEGINQDFTSAQTNIADNVVKDTSGAVVADASAPIDLNDSQSYEEVKTNIAESKSKELEIQKEIEEITKKIQDAEAGKEDAIKEELSLLEKVKELKKDIVKESKDFDETTVVGKTGAEIYNDEGEEVDEGTNEIISSITNKQNDSIFTKSEPAEGASPDTSVTTYTTEASIQNFEALIMKQEELKASTERMETMNTEFSASLAEVQGAMDAVTEATSDSTKSEKDAATAAKNVKKAKQDQAKTIDKAKKSAANYKKEIEKMIKSTLKGKSATKAIEKLNKAMEDLEDAKDSPEKVKKAMEDMQKVLVDTQKTAQTATGAIGNSLEGMKQELNGAGMKGESLENLETNIREVGAEAAKTKMDIDGLNQELDGATPPAQSFGVGLTNIVTGITNFAGAVNSALQGWQTLTHAFTEAETPMEALMGYFTGLTMILPAVTSLISGVTLVKKLFTKATKESGDAQVEEGMKIDINTGKKTLAAGVEALWSAIKSMGWVGVAIGLVAMAAIAGAVIAFNAGKKNQDEAKKEEDKAKKAEEQAKRDAMAAQQFGNELAEAKQRAQDLESSFDDYHSVAEKLASCKRGTEEWNEALRENNDKVLELLEKYPKLKEMAGAITMGPNGELIISEEAENTIKAEAAHDVAREQVASFQFDNRNSAKDIKDAKDRFSMAEKNLVSGAVSDFIVEGEEAQQKLINELIGKYGIADAKNHVPEKSEYYSASYGKMQELDSQKLSEVKSYLEAQANLTNAIEANTAAVQANSLTIGDQAMQGVEEYENSKYKEYIAAIAGNNILNSDVKYEDIYNTISARKWVEGDSNPRWTDTQEQKDIWYDFLKIKGIEHSDIQKGSTDFVEGGVKAKVWNGEEYVEETFDDRYIAETVAGDRALKQSADDNKLMAEQMNKFTSEAQASIFASMVMGNGSMLSPETMKKSQSEINSIIDSMEIGEEVLNKMGFSADKFGGKIEDAEKAFKAYTKEMMASAKAMDTLQDKGKDYLAVIQAGKDASGKWTDAAKESAAEMSKLLSESLGSEADLNLDPDFIANNQKLIEDYINGVEGSGELLQEALSVDAVADIKVGIDDEKVLQEIDSLHNKIAGYADKDFAVGVALDPETQKQFYEDCQNIINKAGMTADEATAYFGKMGYDVEIEEKPQTVSETVWNYKYAYTYEKDPETGETVVTGRDTEATPVVATSTVNVPTIKTITPNASYGGNINKIISPNKNPTVTTGNKTTGKNTGRPSKPDKVEPTKRKLVKEETERYHEITMAIEDYNRELDLLGLKKDAAWGPNKLKYMDQEIKKTKDLIKLNQLKTREINNNLYLDAQAMKRWGANYDKDGRITNYDEMIYKYMDDWYAEQNDLDKRQEALNNKKIETENMADGAAKYAAQDADELAQEQIDKEREASDKWYEDFKEDLAQYEETDQLYKDIILENEQLLRQVAEMRLEAIRTEIELKINFNERELEIINYHLDKTADNFYKMAEGTNMTELYSKKLSSSFNGVELAYKEYNDVLYAYNNNIDNISFDDVLATAEKVIPEMVSQLSELYSLDQEMLEYYNESLSMGAEEFEKYDQFFDINTSKLDHYRNMLSLIGKEADNASIGKFLDAQLKNANNDLKANKSYYEAMQKEYDALYKKWNEEKDNLDKYELDMLERKLLDAKVMLGEAEEEYLASLEVVGEKAQEILENNLDQARKTLEKNLTGSTFDDYMSQLDRLNKKQEEYLTNTNKLYETNKLIRKAQQDMDKTDNVRAKQQYNDYIKHIEQLQKSGNLSQFELSIAQKKYEVLQAEIALKEAQEAKNQVRLTRDNEGNYGYVYTANQDNISKAEQALEDAQNGLYNIGLQGAQDYQSKYNATLQEASEAYQNLVEKRRTGEIATEEEFQKKMKELKEYYYSVLSNYSSLYYTAHDLLVEESTNNEADYLLMGIGNLEDFANFSQQYLNDTNGYFKDYEQNTSDVTTVVSDNLTELKDGTHDVLIESDQLAKTIEDKVVPAMEAEFLRAREVTSQYALERAELEKNIKKYEDLLTTLQALTDLGYTLNADEEISDYSLAIKDLLAQGFDSDSSVVQRLLEKRWDKMGGVDNTNYQALMDEEYAKNGESDWYKTLKLLREFKILKTDWSSQIEEALAAGDTSKAEWLWKAQEEQFAMVSNFEKEIRDYLKGGGYVTDDYVQDRLKVRQNWLNNQAYQASLTSDTSDDEKVAKYKSNDEFMSGIQQSIGTDSSKVDQATAARVEQEKKEEEDSGLTTTTTTTTSSNGKGTGTFAYPLATKGTVTDTFGTRGGKHTAIDIAVPEGTGVLAADSGTVKRINWNVGYNGNCIEIDHGNNYTSLYLHLKSVGVSPGDTVVQGQEIGKSGHTGNTSRNIESGGSNTGDHLDFRIRLNGTDIDPSTLLGFDTGGYTGEWGPEGRLAMLHEKEMVLNKKDTENFLTATNILREISAVLDNNALIASLGAINLQAMTLNSPADQVLQQEVTIHADFPNVTEHNEIELAIDNLINAASQHAYK